MGRKEEADKQLELAKSLREEDDADVAPAASPAGARADEGLPTFALAFLSCSSPLARPGLRSARLQRDRQQPRVADAGRAPASVNSSRRPSSAIPAIPTLHVALGLAYWDRNDYPRALERVPARRRGRTDVRRGPQLAGRRALGEVRSSGRHRRVQEGRRAGSEVRARLHEPGLRAGQERRLRRGGGGVSRRRWRWSRTAWAPTSNLGMALREKGDLEAALAHLRRVAAGDPANAGVHYELGQTLRQSGDLAGAVAAFEKAIEIDPELREGYYALGHGAEAAGRRPARKPPRPRRKPRRRSVHARAGGRRTRRADRRPRAAHRGAAPRREPRRGAQPAGLHAGPAGRSAVGARPPGARGRAPARVRRGPLQPRRRAVVQRLARTRR